MNARAANSPLRLPLGLLAAVLIVLAAGCGGEGQSTDERVERTQTEQAPDERPRTERAPAEQRVPTEERGLRNFRRAVGGLCSGFYEDAGALQARLREQGLTEDSPPRAKRVGLEIVGEIQARTGRFLRDVRRVPLPDGSPGRDARRFVASTARFLGLQRASTGFIRRTLLGSADPSTRARLQRLQRQLTT